MNYEIIGAVGAIWYNFPKVHQLHQKYETLKLYNARAYARVQEYEFFGAVGAPHISEVADV